MAGGFTAVACHAQHPAGERHRAVTRFILEEAGRRAGPGLPRGGHLHGLAGANLSEYGDQKAAGAVAFSDDGRPVMNAMLMRRALEYARTFDLPLISHDEDLDLRGDGVMHEGRVSLELG